MAKTNRYNHRQSNPITEECIENGVSINRWMHRHGVNYSEQHRNLRVQKNAVGQDYSRSKSRWADWLDRINDT